MHSCDGCTACCKILKIVELSKPGNTWCAHCKIGTGCTIYDTRPESCRVYQCIWLKTQTGEKPMPLELRPDRSHVVIGTTNQGEDLVLYVSPDRPDAWKRGAAARFVATMKARGVAMIVSCGEAIKAV
jgi:Fe-S-cluster containining protein